MSDKNKMLEYLFQLLHHGLPLDRDLPEEMVKFQESINVKAFEPEERDLIAVLHDGTTYRIVAEELGDAILTAFPLVMECVFRLLADNGMLPQGTKFVTLDPEDEDVLELMLAGERYLSSHTGSVRDYLTEYDGDGADDSVLETMTAGEESVMKALVELGGRDAEKLNTLLEGVFEGDLLPHFVRRVQ